MSSDPIAQDPHAFDALAFEGRGLLPVIVQDAVTGEIRMAAFATPEAVRLTLETGRATFFSRSRGEIWVKGKTSGNGLAVLRVLVDCDADCLVYVCEPEGPSCHTGATSCFFRLLELRDGTAKLEPLTAEQTALGELETSLEARKSATAASSYTKSLYDAGPPKIGAKIREEAGELAAAVADESDDRVVSEAADVLYHVLVGLRFRDVPVRRVLAELASRAGTSGHAEKASRGLRV